MSQPIEVLLVEDNPGDADLTREALEHNKLRVEIVVMPDGVAAMTNLTQRAADGLRLPDLIILDLNLPRRSGHEVLADIKKHPILRSIPVVILTSSDSPDDVERTYSLGAACFVTKPVGLKEFQTIVGSIKDFWFTVVKLP